MIEYVKNGIIVDGNLILIEDIIIKTNEVKIKTYNLSLVTIE